MGAGEQATSGRVAIVLAASKGLGRASAVALADQGWDLVVCSRTEPGVAATVEDLTSRGVQATGVVADVSVAADIEHVFAHADETFGRLDALVCNAGGPPHGGFNDVDDDGWARGFELTLMSMVRAFRAAIPRMQVGGHGRLIVLGSSSARQPIPNLILSNAYRPAILGVVKSLASELAADGITVNMVSPGRIATERLRSLDVRNAERQGMAVEEIERASQARIPIGRYGRPEELAAAVAFLASDAAGYITGQSLLVDGGLVTSLP